MIKRATLSLFILGLAPVLSGCVALAGAGLVAAGTAGISAVRQERTVGDAVDDVRITSNIQGELGRQSASNFFNVKTTVVEGRVLLTGRVANPQTRLDATRIAWSIEGVRRVDNEIEVTDDAGWVDRPKDLFIRTEIAADLLADRSIRDVNYTIDVVNGVVYLSGVAQNQAELDRVIARAGRFTGVKRVESYVVLKDDPGRFYGGFQSGT
jgi:osmotically-inducible protein OsmY